jgi:hypothetical protein
VVGVGTRTLSESGTVGRWPREQVELFCITKLINCVIDADEEFICMDIHFAIGGAPTPPPLHAYQSACALRVLGCREKRALVGQANHSLRVWALESFHTLHAHEWGALEGRRMVLISSLWGGGGNLRCTS